MIGTATTIRRSPRASSAYVIVALEARLSSRGRGQLFGAVVASGREALPGVCSAEFAGEAGFTLEDFVTVPPVLVLSCDSVPHGDFTNSGNHQELLGELPATMGLSCSRARTPIGH